MTDHGSTALIVEVPEAEPAVGAHRRRLDASARLGVPAHVTVLYPFVPATRVDPALLDDLAARFAGVAPFGYRFSGTSWFDEAVLWLAPDDPAPFRVLTETVWAAYPERPPFGGEFDDVVPHLTVAHAVGLDLMRAAEADLASRLPVSGRAVAVTMLRQAAAGERWQPAARFPLGAAKRVDPRGRLDG